MLQPAGFWRRLGAYLIDIAIVYLGMVLVLIPYNLLLIRKPDISAPVFIILLVIYNAVMVSRTGQTIGKRWLGIRVTGADGQKVTFRQAIFRESIGKLLSSIFMLGLITAEINARNQTWHDKLAKTVVIQPEKKGSPESVVSRQKKLIFWIVLVPGAIIITFSQLFLILITIYSLFAIPYEIVGSAMEPNYRNGQIYLADKAVFRLSGLKRGDVVIFNSPASASFDNYRRIIGLPGDKIQLAGEKVYLNGQPLNEPYLSPNTLTSARGYLTEGVEVVIPKGQYILLGDNRINTVDSRDFGPIASSEIIDRIVQCLANCGQ